jgi:hypothetical protein
LENYKKKPYLSNVSKKFMVSIFFILQVLVDIKINLNNKNKANIDSIHNLINSLSIIFISKFDKHKSISNLIEFKNSLLTSQSFKELEKQVQSLISFWQKEIIILTYPIDILIEYRFSQIQLSEKEHSTSIGVKLTLKNFMLYQVKNISCEIIQKIGERKFSLKQVNLNISSNQYIHEIYGILCKKDENKPQYQVLLYFKYDDFFKFKFYEVEIQ